MLIIARTTVELSWVGRSGESDHWLSPFWIWNDDAIRRNCYMLSLLPVMSAILEIWHKMVSRTIRYF